MSSAVNRWILAAVLAALVGSACAASEGWTDDFDAAKRLAAESDRDMLVNFTGSDWCGWCVKLRQDVFSQKAFLRDAPRSFVLVELDYPRQKVLSEAVKKQNELLGQQFDVRRYPTIMLCDARGVPYAQTEYRKDGPEAYLEHLNQLRSHRQKRDEGLAQALKLEGPEKAKALVAVLEALPLHDALINEFYRPVLEVIAKSDPEDGTGFIRKMSSSRKLREFTFKMMELGRKKDLEGAIAHVDRTLAEGGLEVDATQQVLMSRCMIFARQKKFDEAIRVADEAIALAPESRLSGEIRAFQVSLRKHLEAPAAEGGK